MAQDKPEHNIDTSKINVGND